MLIVLMYTVSLSIQPSFKLNIHNKCLNVDLVSPTYVTGNNLECHRPPGYKVCARDTMRFALIIKSGNWSCGALIYRLQKRQPHNSTEISEDTSSAAHLLVVWEISEYKKLYVDVLLVEHDKGFEWNKDDLIDLYRKNFDRFNLCPDSTKEIWSMDDNVALMTTFEIMNEDRILDIAISEIERDDNTRTPVHIDLKR
jgi:hypothetical protein